MWDANLQAGLQCVVCKAHWDGPPEWDRSAVMRKFWIIESRWRIGFGHGRWQHLTELPGDHSASEIDSILEQYRTIEKQRCARLRPALTFEFRAGETFLEVFRGRVA